MAHDIKSITTGMVISHKLIFENLRLSREEVPEKADKPKENEGGGEASVVVAPLAALGGITIVWLELDES